MKSILLVDREPDVRLLLNLKLSAQGWSVTEAQTPWEAGPALERSPFDLLALDLDLPGGAAWDILETAALNSRPAVLGLTRTATPGKVWGHASGVHAFLVKPFGLDAIEDLPAVAERLMSLDRAPIAPPPPPISIGAITLDPAIDLVTFAGKEIKFTATEYRVFSTLFAQNSRAVDVISLLQEIWGEAAETSSANVRLRFIIYRIRRKLAAAGAGAGTIINIRAGGYAYYPVDFVPLHNRARALS